MYCKYCGKDLQDDAIFCNLCGKKIERKKLTCKKCGKELPNDVEFCISCGEKLIKEKLTCKKCGKELPDDVEFCISCGEKLIKEKLTCKKCGKELPDDVEFCISCGEKLIKEKLTCKKCGKELPGNAMFCNVCGEKVINEKNTPKIYKNTSVGSSVNYVNTVSKTAEINVEPPAFDNLSITPTQDDSAVTGQNNIVNVTAANSYRKQNKSRVVVTIVALIIGIITIATIIGIKMLRANDNSTNAIANRTVLGKHQRNTDNNSNGTETTKDINNSLSQSDETNESQDDKVIIVMGEQEGLDKQEESEDQVSPPAPSIEPENINEWNLDGAHEGPLPYDIFEEIKGTYYSEMNGIRIIVASPSKIVWEDGAYRSTESIEGCDYVEKELLLYITLDGHEGIILSVYRTNNDGMCMLTLDGGGWDYERTHAHASLSRISKDIINGYLIPYSSERYLTEADLIGFSNDELRKARNEIVARYGRKFKDAELQAYFEAQSWYNGTIEADDFNKIVKLTEIEEKNMEFIKAHER